MPFAKLNDINMYYETQGQGEPLVLIAGFSGDHHMWDAVVSDFAKHYLVIMPNNRGAGQTTVAEGPYTIEQMADDTAALCDHLGIKKANFIGSSMGGCVVQDLAYRHPELINKLVIVNSTMSKNNAFTIYAQAQYKLLEAGVPPRPMLEATLAWVFNYEFLTAPGNLETIIEAHVQDPHPFTLPAYKAQFAALKSFDSTEWAHKISCPTLVTGSDKDIIFDMQVTKSIADAIPNSQYHLFKNIGHAPHIECPVEFTKIVEEFLNG